MDGGIGICLFSNILLSRIKYVRYFFGQYGDYFSLFCLQLKESGGGGYP